MMMEVKARAPLNLAIAVLVTASATVAEAEEPPRLWQPEEAVSFLLAPRAPAQPPLPRAAWDGSLTDGIVRFLFGGYRQVLSSQDMPVCGFSPSCSRFSQRAIARCGFFEGALLSMDRLIRDHPLALGLYPVAEDGRLLKDDPERYCLSSSP
jgi:putative component of membrane protein insertase Oxa1/YidC/SpoIIIJ protein YidD